MRKSESAEIFTAENAEPAEIFTAENAENAENCNFWGNGSRGYALDPHGEFNPKEMICDRDVSKPHELRVLCGENRSSLRPLPTRSPDFPGC